MPEIKILIDNDEYTLQCEDGEEEELKKAVEVVNEKMNVFKGEIILKKTTKLVMVALLLASESNEKLEIEQKEKKKITEIEHIILKLEQTISESQ